MPNRKESGRTTINRVILSWMNHPLEKENNIIIGSTIRPVMRNAGPAT
jgi:hypothetical protein